MSILNVNQLQPVGGGNTITVGSSNIDYSGSITGNISVDGNLTVTGVVSNEDVTNIDSVGVVTARNGLQVTGGNVGINSTVPGEKLDVLGTIRASAGTNQYMHMYPVAGAGYFDVRNQTSYPSIVFRQIGSGGIQERLRIDLSGNIGIGTDNPGAKLEVFDETSNTIINVKSGDAGAVLNLIDPSQRSSIEQNGTTLKIVSDTGAEFASSDIRLQVDGSTRMRVQSTGNIAIDNGNLVFSTSGTGIDFSATADGSGTDSSELLDDYEEGTFTPQINFGNLSVSSQATTNGFYVKVGRHVRCDIWILFNGTNLSGTPVANAGVWISGLPYAGQIASRSTQWVGIPVAMGRLPEYRGRNDSTDFNKIYLYMGDNSSDIYLGVNKDPQSPISTDFLYGMSEKSFSSLIGAGYNFEFRTSLSYMAAP